MNENEVKFVDCVIQCTTCNSELHTRSTEKNKAIGACSQCNNFFLAKGPQLVGKAKIFMDKINKKKEANKNKENKNNKE